MSELQITRDAFVFAQGYDCPNYCESYCPERVAQHPGTSHGWHGDEWSFVVKAPCVGGVELRVFTPHLPAHIPLDRRWHFFSTCTNTEVFERPFTACAYMHHTPWLLRADCVREPPEPEPCRVSEPCIECVDFGTIAVNERIAELLRPPVFGQLDPFPHATDALWRLLEAKLLESVAECGRRRCEDGDLRWRRCEQCSGKGVVDL